MNEPAPPPLAGSLPVVSLQQRSRLRRYSRTLLWLCRPSGFVIAAIVMMAPHVLHAIHPGPTGGGG